MIGKIIRQRYQIVQQLQAGGYGETYIAEDLDIPVSPKPKCVVKRLHPKAIDPDIQRLFQKEAEILYKLGQDCEQIPKLHAYFEEDRVFYLVQELIEGHNLSQDFVSGQPWCESDVVQFLQELLEVLAYVHRHNVIHRDIKPSNLMRRKPDKRLMLIDFGAVKEVSTLQVDPFGQTTRTIAIGTIGYMPSEQALGKPRLSSDVYAVGMMAIQALTGATPHQLPEDNNGEVIWRDRAQVSEALATLLDRMVRYHFSQRYQSAIEARQDLKAILEPDSDFSPAVTGIAQLKPVKIGDKWGYKDETGQIAIAPQFEKAGKFSPIYTNGHSEALGLAEVKVGAKYGYIDATGKIAIEPQFDKAGGFTEGLAKVKIGDRSTLINEAGEILFDEVSSFCEGLARVRVGAKYGYIHKSGQLAIQPGFDQAWHFSEELAVVKIGDQYGYIDKSGQIICQPHFDQAWSFSDGLAVVRIGDRFSYIDKTGQVITEFFNEVKSFCEGLAAVNLGDKWGYIDKTGNLVIEPLFSYAGNFSQGRATVEIQNKLLGLVPLGEQRRTIDRAGKFID
jgi:serine/threonine-protein kinase